MAAAAASARRRLSLTLVRARNGPAPPPPLPPSALGALWRRPPVGLAAAAVPRRAAHVPASLLRDDGTTAVDRGDPASRSEAAGVVNAALQEETCQLSCGTDADGRRKTSAAARSSDGKADPQLSVVGSGTSLAVLARLPVAQGAKLFATRGAVIGKSPGVVSKFRVEENVLAAARSRVLVYEELSCASDIKSESGDVLLAPRNSWNSVAALKLDGTNDIQLRAGALLARTGRVFLQGTGGRTSGMDLISKVFSCKVTGRGSIVITATGGLHKVMLEENEQYLVNTRRMVAWDLRTSHASKTSRTQRLELPTEALTHGGRGTTGHRSATEEPSVEQSGSGNARTAVAVFAAALKERLAYIGKCTWTMFSRWMRELLLGRDDYVKLTGPGVVYLSGRRGVTGLQRIGVGMDRVAINLPARPTGPPPNRLKTAQRRAHTSDQVLDNPLRPDVPVAKDPLTGNDSTSGPKLITKSADEPLLKA